MGGKENLINGAQNGTKAVAWIQGHCPGRKNGTKGVSDEEVQGRRIALNIRRRESHRSSAFAASFTFNVIAWRSLPKEESLTGSRSLHFGQNGTKKFCRDKAFAQTVASGARVAPFWTLKGRRGYRHVLLGHSEMWTGDCKGRMRPKSYRCRRLGHFARASRRCPRPPSSSPATAVRARGRGSWGPIVSTLQAVAHTMGRRETSNSRSWHCAAFRTMWDEGSLISPQLLESAQSGTKESLMGPSSLHCAQ